MAERFWRRLDALVAAAEIVIDRPAGSAHPRYPDVIYPLEYGYLRGTTAADGDGVDVWVGSLAAQRVTGVVCTVDQLKREVELKLLLGCTPAEMETALAVHNNAGQSGYLVPRPA
jgi:inorganic pyrophosphatase